MNSIRKTRRRLYSVGMMALILACLCIMGSMAEEAPEYTENALNYVENSMDVSQGIPDNAIGVLLRIRRNGVLRVATEPYFAPQEFIDPALDGQDQYQGADMELARLIAERMGVELSIVPMGFADVLTAVAEDQCDLAISALSFTPGRAASNEMSKGYYFADVPRCSILIREADAGEINSIDSLAQKILIAQQGSVQETMMIGNIMHYQEFRRVSTTRMIYTAIEKGEADAGAVDRDTALEYISRNPQCGLTLAEGIEFALDEKYRGDRIAAKKDELQLMYFVNGVIDEMLEKNLYTEWIEKARARANELGL